MPAKLASALSTLLTTAVPVILVGNSVWLLLNSCEGTALLEQARLPGGEPAFTEREIRHMADVRAVVAGLLLAWAIALACAVAAAVALRRLGEPGALGRALFRGSLLTLGALALVGILMGISFDTFFDGFHAILFEEGTWQFKDHLTLRQLYPDAFWAIAGATVAGLVLLQALAMVLLLRLRQTSSRNGRYMFARAA